VAFGADAHRGTRRLQEVVRRSAPRRPTGPAGKLQRPPSPVAGPRPACVVAAPPAKACAVCRLGRPTCGEGLGAGLARRPAVDPVSPRANRASWPRHLCLAPPMPPLVSAPAPAFCCPLSPPRRRLLPKSRMRPSLPTSNPPRNWRARGQCPPWRHARGAGSAGTEPLPVGALARGGVALAHSEGPALAESPICRTCVVLRWRLPRAAL